MFIFFAVCFFKEVDFILILKILDKQNLMHIRIPHIHYQKNSLYI